LVQGIILAAMGGYGLWQPSQAGIVISLVLAVLLVLQAFWVIIQALRGNEFGMSVFNLLAAGGGLVAGLGILVPYLFNRDFDLPTSWSNFGLGLTIVGILTLASSFIERPNQGVAWATLIRGVLQTAFGIYVFYVSLTEQAGHPALIRWMSIALLALGVVLIIWSGILYSRRRGPDKVEAPAAA
jgi:uncharacterized membrane protein HdeD (DUF308 family)